MLSTDIETAARQACCEQHLLTVEVNKKQALIINDVLKKAAAAARYFASELASPNLFEDSEELEYLADKFNYE